MKNFFWKRKHEFRAQQVQSDTEKRAHDLDLKFLGSMFTQVLKSHGKYSRYLALVVGPFANLSDEFKVLCDFLGQACVIKAMDLHLENQPEERVGN